MPIAIIQAVPFTNNSIYTATGTFSSNVTVGNRIIVMFAHTYAGCPPSVTDTLTNSYTFHGSQLGNGTGHLLEAFSAPITNGGACTVNPAAACGGLRSGLIVEVSGLDTSPYDGENDQRNTSSPISTAGVTTTADGDLLLGMYIVASGTPTITFTNGGIALYASPGNNDQHFYRIAGAAGSNDITATATDFPIDGYITAWKAAPTPPSGNPAIYSADGTRATKVVNGPTNAIVWHR